MSAEFITTNAASGGIKLDGNTLERVAGRSERPRLFIPGAMRLGAAGDGRSCPHGSALNRGRTFASLGA